MQMIIAFCQRPFSLIIAFLVMIACIIAFQYLATQLGADILDILNNYDRGMVEQKMLAYGEVGRLLYARATLTLDLLYPLAYGVFFIGILARLTQHTQFRPLIYLPVFVVGLDVLENVQIYAMLVSFPELTDRQIMLASLSTQAKWLLVRAMMLVLLLLASLALSRKLVDMVKKWRKN